MHVRFSIGRRFQIGGDDLTKLLEVFDWTSVPEGCKFVDVGGGVGTASKVLVDSQKHFQIIVQDRPAVVANGLAVHLTFALKIPN